MCPPCEHEQRVRELEKRVVELEEMLSKYKNPPKDSSNSGIAPSQDKNRVTYPKRDPSGKKPGGQTGHKGHFHRLRESPDEIVACPVAQQCRFCGSKHLEVIDTLLQRRQVVDIPRIRPHVTEYRQQQARCKKCKRISKGAFPETVKAPVQMGESAKALSTYFKTVHALSDERVVNVFNDVLGLSISEGWVENTLTRQAHWLLPTYQGILSRIKQSRVVGSDETGVRISGKKGFSWVFETKQLACFKTALSRGFCVIEQTLGKSFTGTWVSDRYGAQLKVEADFNQLCLAHIVRECRYLEQSAQCAWATQLKTTLTQAMDFRREQGKGYQPKEHFDILRKIEAQLAGCFAHAPPKNDKARRLHKHLRYRQDLLLRFLYDPRVPYDNNGSERALRHWALLRKVFGGFRTLEGINRYDVLLSVIESAKRQKLNLLDVLSGKAQLSFA